MPKEKVSPLTESRADLISFNTTLSSKVTPKAINQLAGLTVKDLHLIAKTSKSIPFCEMLKANVSFTENKGQLERFENFEYPAIGSVKFYSKAFCGNAYFGSKGIGYAFQRLAFREADVNANQTERTPLTKAEKKETLGFSVQFVNACAQPEIVGEQMQHTRFNFLKGNNPQAFVTDVASYEQIRYKDLYPGIDLVYYNKNNQLKYDFILEPHANISSISLLYQGIDRLHLNEKGELEMTVRWGTLLDRKPYSYQEINGKRKEVKVAYMLKDEHTLGFSIKGNYNSAYPLVIDPYTVEWSTYIGTATSDDGYLESTCMDNTGRTLGTGWTNNAFPVAASPNGFDKTTDGTTEAFVFRVNTTGTALDYVSYLGGSGGEVGTGIAVNAAGEICVSGHTSSRLQTAFVEVSPSTLNVATGAIPVTVAGIGSYGAVDNLILINGSNVLVGQVNGFVNGTTLNFVVASTIGSGSHTGWQIFRMTQVPFPTTTTAIQPTKSGADGLEDIFYVKLNGAGNNLIYGTYYGGTDSQVDYAIDMALDPSGNAYITGRTQTTTNFATAGVYKTTAQGGYDAYVLKINNNNTLGYCTYVGGAANDIGKGIVANAAGEVFVSGMTASASQATAGAFQTAQGGADDAFVAKLNNTGTISYFTYLGGSSFDGGAGIDVSTSGEAVIVGTTTSANFPMQNPFDNTLSVRDGFLTRLNSTGTALVYSTYFGGDGADNGKGFDYTTIHKNGGVKLSAGELPVVVLGIHSTAASMSPYLVSPITFNTVNQSGGATTHNGATFSGNDDWFISVFDATASACLFGMYMGGSDNDYPTAGVNIDLSSGCVTFGGGVHSLPFPVTAGAFQTQRVNSTGPDQSTIAKICLTEILPVSFLYFEVYRQGNVARLEWATSSEEENAYFEIQKSADGKAFFPLEKITGNGTTQQTSYYHFDDPTLKEGFTYYRLKQVDISGKSKFSEIKKLWVQSNAFVEIYPNPGNGILQIQSSGEADCALQVQVLNALGQQVKTQTEHCSSEGHLLTLDISEQPAGVYILHFSRGTMQENIRYVKE
ncbi:MAG: T9SS type A sorting domain-containing protein [Cytophagaceae bacterium]|jgi:hypothetical protein|nr:T9SS type A sorting domain-containing protein [Cytophagaceae bacterium]